MDAISCNSFLFYGLGKETNFRRRGNFFFVEPPKIISAYVPDPKILLGTGKDTWKISWIRFHLRIILG